MVFDSIKLNETYNLNCIDLSVFKIWWHWLKSATDDFSNDTGVGNAYKVWFEYFIILLTIVCFTTIIYQTKYLILVSEDPDFLIKKQKKL